MGIHFFRRTTRDEHLDRDLRPMQRIDVPLPNSPLSYDGVILKIRWCVRIRLFLTQGREFVEERFFVLGRVPPAQAVHEAPQQQGEDEGADEPASAANAATQS